MKDSDVHSSRLFQVALEVKVTQVQNTVPSGKNIRVECEMNVAPMVPMFLMLERVSICKAKSSAGSFFHLLPKRPIVHHHVSQSGITQKV